jgi:hypothetical protein
MLVNALPFFHERPAFPGACPAGFSAFPAMIHFGRVLFTLVGTGIAYLGT